MCRSKIMKKTCHFEERQTKLGLIHTDLAYLKKKHV